MTNNIYDEIKRLELFEFALAPEWEHTLDRAGTNIRAVQTRNAEGDRVVFYKKTKPSGHYTFTNFSRNLRLPKVTRNTGTIIDFIIDYYKGDEAKAKEYINYSFCFNPNPEIKEYIATQKECSTTVEQRLEDLNKAKHFSNDNYLLDRGIPCQVFKDYCRWGGYKAKANPYFAIFPTFKKIDKGFKGEFFGIYKTTSQKHKYGKFKNTKGRPQGILVMNKKTPFEKVYICESPIDALSLEALHILHDVQGERAYIATCGTIAYSQLQILKNLIPQLPQVAIALDNGAEAMVKQIQNLFNFPLDVKYPKKGKDWNEYLNIINK